MDPQTAASLEALRARAMSGPPAGVGIPGGTPAINTPSPVNPVATAGVAQPPQPSRVPQGMSGGGTGNPFTAGISALQKSQPDEAMTIVKGLISRLGSLPPSGNTPSPAPAPAGIGGMNG